MSDPTIYRMRYSQIFALCILTSFLYMLGQSLPGGLANFGTNLPGRKLLIENFTRLRLKMGDRVFNQALVGKDGWLEYTGGQNLDFFQNNPILSSGERRDLKKNLKILYEELRERNILLVVVIAPNKATIYPDKLPSEIQKIRERSELEMLVNQLGKEGIPVLLDLRPALQEARQRRDIYYRTDTHWNAYGALIAYQEILKSLSKSYPGLAPNNIDSFTITTNQPSVRDISALMGTNQLLETGYAIAPIKDDLSWIRYSEGPLAMKIATSSKDKLPKLLMYYDSFGDYLIPLLAPHFSQSTFIFNLSSYPDTLTLKQIEVTKPDIVIIEFVERYQYNLYNFLNNYGLEVK